MIRPKAAPVRLDPFSYESVRQQVLRRDGWRCQSCGTMSNLEIHHKQFRSHSGEDSDEKLDHPLRSMPRQNASPRFHVTLSLARTQNPWIAFGEARSCPAALRGRIRVIHDVRRHGEDDLARLSPPRKRSEGETTTDCRSTVVVGVIGDAGFMRNGDGQTAAHPGIRNSGITVETLGEVMIQIERPLVEGARA